MLFSTLVPKGQASRGLAITNAVLGTLALGFGIIALIPNVFGPGPTPTGLWIGGIGAAAGAATIITSFYAAFHPIEEAEPLTPAQHTPAPQRPPPPQLRMWFGPRMIGLAVAL